MPTVCLLGPAYLVPRPISSSPGMSMPAGLSKPISCCSISPQAFSRVALSRLAIASRKKIVSLRLRITSAADEKMTSETHCMNGDIGKASVLERLPKQPGFAEDEMGRNFASEATNDR